MNLRASVAALFALLSLSGPALARSGEITVTGVISNVDEPARHAIVTPPGGAPIKLQFVWNVGGVCAICLGGGLKGPTFDKNITEGSTWTVVYVPSYPDGGTNTVVRVLKPGQSDTGPQRGVAPLVVPTLRADQTPAPAPSE